MEQREIGLGLAVATVGLGTWSVFDHGPEGRANADGAVAAMLGPPRVTAVIPATANADHAVANARATRHPGFSWDERRRVDALWRHR